MIPRLLYFLILVPALGGPSSQADRVLPQLRQEAVLDSVRTEMAQGRDWHAVRRLQAAFPNGPGGNRELLLLFASAEAGWGHWTRVGALLEGPLEKGEVDGPDAWYLLGRALEGEERWEAAEAAYGQVLAAEGPEGSPNRLEARVRRARVLGRLGWYSRALVDAEAIGGEDSTMAGWVALELAERAAADGFREETRQALFLMGPEKVRRLGWSLLPVALLAAGDSTGAEAAYWSALPSLSSASDQAVAWGRVGTLRLARGDSVGAQGAFHQVLALSGAGSEGVWAAEALLKLGFDSVHVALAGARALAGAGRHEEALEAFGLYERLLGGAPPPLVALGKVRSHLTLGQLGVSLALATELGRGEDPVVAAPALVLRIQSLRRLGRGAEALRVEEELVGRFPDRPEAVEVLFLRADALRDRGDREGAIKGYQETVELAPAQDLAGQARMGMGQILLGMGRDIDALGVYSDYVRDFPEGRRWDEAAFWAGRLLLSLDRMEEGRELLNQLRRDYPISYYSVRAGELLGELYDPPIPAASVDPQHLLLFFEAGLASFDRLLAAGIQRGAAWEANIMADRFRVEEDPLVRQGGLLRLAKELNSRGFTREGINLGWELRREGRPWDRELLAAVYPFPYQDIVLAEAGERGVDPYLIAGLIRQESAFWVEARSRADARGLMQVLPATGRELARASGPVGFQPDSHLYEAEINIHLGVAFFADMRRRFGEDLPIILSAYNAGPTRATRWREFPEVRDMPRFVERIPFVETRGYVKNVLLNREIYSWLYGQASYDPGASKESRPFLP
ncbi:MAG: transglycosylase SLT domain-containing protein [Gemmatimonadota bacterium]